MSLKDDLLRGAWYAFSALDRDNSGKVSKSRLKVLSHNLQTVLNIPHDLLTLEEHFQEDEKSPVSRQGYMPYLNTYILDKVQEGAFVKEAFDKFCWTLTAKKNFRPRTTGSPLSEQVAFKLWCMFNFLSEDVYPPVVVPEEAVYLLKKLSDALRLEWQQGDLNDYIFQNPLICHGLSVWQFLEMVECEMFFPPSCKDALTLAIDHVYQEMCFNVIKKGYLWKKGLLRRNWNERWFVLKPSHLCYYTSEAEDLKDKKGEILLDNNCILEVLPDKERRKCLFCIITPRRTYEIRTSDTCHRQEWMLAIQMAIGLQAEHKDSLHKDLKLKRRVQRQERERRKAEKERELQIQDQMNNRWEVKEQQTLQQQETLHRALEKQLKQVEEAQSNMQVEMAQKEEEAVQHRKKIQDLETMKWQVEKALQAEIQAKLEEEKIRVALAKLLVKEDQRLSHLMQLKEEQNELIRANQQEKEELQQEVMLKSQALEQAHCELNLLRGEPPGKLPQLGRSLIQQNCNMLSHHGNRAFIKWEVTCKQPLAMSRNNFPQKVSDGQSEASSGSLDSVLEEGLERGSVIQGGVASPKEKGLGS